MIKVALRKHQAAFAALLLMLVSALPLGAAEPTMAVTGVVTMESDGEPLTGVSVRLKGTQGGVVTDVDGKYAIRAAKGEVLVFSYVGCVTKEAKVTGKVLDISLSEDNLSLADLVVVGYGTMKRSDITGSVVSVTDKDIKKTVVTSVDQALQGRAAGVQVTQNSGSPGGGISVSIRGTNSLNGNEPLYVIDGIAVDGQTNGNSSALANVNPSDIISIEVLKDASATAIYGSRASNGVVLVSTRRGAAGKTHISYEGYYATQRIPKYLKTMNLRQ